MIHFIDFISFINEKIDLTRVPPKQNEKVDVFLGRLQPIHKGHFFIIKKMKNPIIVLIKGKKSSLNRKRNPFPLEYQEYLLKKLDPNLKIITAPGGFLPLILFKIRELGYEPNVIYAGGDRIKSYKRMIDNLPDEVDLNVKFKETPRIASATEVRKALKNNDYEKFKDLMPKKLWDEYDTMINFIK